MTKFVIVRQADQVDLAVELLRKLSIKGEVVVMIVTVGKSEEEAEELERLISEKAPYSLILAYSNEDSPSWVAWEVIGSHVPLDGQPITAVIVL